MKNIYKILAASFLLLLMPSCNEDFLDTTPADRYSDQVIWSDQNLVRAYTNRVYQGIHYPHGTLYLSDMVDESMGQGYWGLSTINSSIISPSDLNLWDPWHWGQALRALTWDHAYQNIRACNIFFENIENAPFDDETVKNTLIGEVTFLRAYIYHWLVALYGGVPLITESYGVNDDFSIARDSYEDCIDFIISECDKAANLLPASGDKLRGTKGAALALKSRTTLFAASDFANSNASWAGSYSNPELVGYTGGDRTQRWTRARDAAKAVIDLGEYNLFNANPTSTEDAIKGCTDLFLDYGNEEDIFLIMYDVLNGSWPWTYFNRLGPNGWHCWGLHAPINQLVDCYQMIDGTTFDWNNPAHKAQPYINRDPRFYATVLYDGAYYKPRPDDIAHLDPEGRVQVGYYEQADGSYLGGLDTKDGIDDWNALPIGYYMRKFIDPDIWAHQEPQDLPWRAFRYGEIILNYVEACIELGQEDEARTYLNMIRTRAGMPDITDSGDDLKQRYRNERKIELAFEQHRYFDVRRWMIADQVYTDAKGISATYNLKTDGSGEYEDPIYELNETSWEARKFENHYYLLPIKLDEINRNNKLIQNPLY